MVKEKKPDFSHRKHNVERVCRNYYNSQCNIKLNSEKPPAIVSFVSQLVVNLVVNCNFKHIALNIGIIKLWRIYILLL